MCILLRKSIFYNCITLISTQYNTNWRVITIVHHFASIVIYIHLHLPQILMGQLINLQINQYKAAQQTIVKNKIYIKIFFIISKTFLASLK